MPADVRHEGLVVEDQGIGLPASVPVGLVDREALFELGRAVDLARDQERAVEEERGLAVLHDLEAGALQRGLARRWQQHRVAARKSDSAPAPELGVDEDVSLRLTPQLAHESVHPGGVIPVTVAQHDDVDVTRVELESAHVLHQAVRRDSGVEQNRGCPVRFRHPHQAREAMLGSQEVARLVALEEARRDFRVGGERQGSSLGGTVVCEQQVGRVVDQRRDAQRVDRVERNWCQRGPGYSGVGSVRASQALSSAPAAARPRVPGKTPGRR